MALYKGKYRIESARLPGWDYSSAGYYFITVCTYDRACLFGHVTEQKMLLNDFGRIVQNEWDKSFVIRRELLRDEFVVMPNHFHGIVRVVETGDHVDGNADVCAAGVVDAVVETSGRTSLREPKPTVPPRIRPKSVSSLMAGVKSVITKRINEISDTPGVHVLQYRFHDHIIRDANELSRIRQYIKNNPSNWKYDKFNGGTSNRVSEESATYGEESWMI